MNISPVPTDEEAAAIVAAVDGLWPRPVVADGGGPGLSRWRFSGRWWNKPSAVGRPRP